jgi:uncharacterized iron-regulated membrane protein
MWRTLHRWVAIVAAAFLLNLGVTGVLMNFDELRLVLQGNGPDTLFVKPRPLPETDLRPVLKRGYDVAHSLAPNHTMTAIRLSMQGEVPRVQVTFSGPQGGDITVNGNTGERMAGPPGPSGRAAKLDRYQFFKRLHRGDFIGSFHGRYLFIMAGFCLLYLCVSGTVMYAKLLRVRRQHGHRSWYW